MKITLSKSQWQAIGKRAGWLTPRSLQTPVMPENPGHTKHAEFDYICEACGKVNWADINGMPPRACEFCSAEGKWKRAPAGSVSRLAATGSGIPTHKDLAEEMRRNPYSLYDEPRRDKATAEMNAILADLKNFVSGPAIRDWTRPSLVPFATKILRWRKNYESLGCDDTASRDIVLTRLDEILGLSGNEPLDASISNHLFFSDEYVFGAAGREHGYR